MKYEKFLNAIKIDSLTLSSGKLSHDNLSQLKEFGVEYIVNLSDDETLDNGDNEETVVTKSGFQRYSILVDFWNPKKEDFISFCSIYSMIADKKKIIHCDLNYRVTFFIAYYNMLFLGWGKNTVDAFISQVWNPEEFGAWDTFGEKLQHYIQHKKNTQQLDSKIEKVIAAMTPMFSEQNSEAIYRKRLAYLKEKLVWWIMHDIPVELILPGFPLKSPNIGIKVMGALPDQGEYLALRELNNVCHAIADVYEPGAVLNIFSDSRTFSDILNIPDSVGKEYNLTVRKLNQWSNIKWHSYASLHEKNVNFNASNSTVDEILGFYLKKASSYVQQKTKTPNKEDIHAIERMLSLELYSHNESLTPEQKKWVATLANKMFVRGMGLSEMIKYHFPKEVRLSTHLSSSHEKIPITLLPGDMKMGKVPWSQTPLLSHNGKWKLFHKHEIEKEYNIMTIENKEKPWGVIELPIESHDDFKAQIIHEGRFGILLTHINNHNKRNCLDLPTALLEKLILNYGFVVIRGIDVIDEDNLTQFTAQFGNPYIWQFGPVHKVKPHDKPDGFVHSLEDIPLHWDLSMLPPDNPFVEKDPNFAAKSFVLYCKKAPLPGEGQTTLVDAKNALDILDSKTRKEWEQFVMSYHTPFTYFGGKERQYPLIAKHPITGEKVLRYQESSHSDLQKFMTKVVGKDTDSDETVRLINNLAYDERNLVEHIWQDGDIVIIDNYSVLHGRRSMSENSADRELWRVQVY
ncbi:L-tyrosine/L-tryptophan isonitrile synthase family protein [Erwinia sp. AnSW2-5]